MSSRRRLLMSVTARVAASMAMTIAAMVAHGQTMSARCDGLDANAAPMKRAVIFLTVDKSAYSLKQSLVVDAGIRNAGPDVIYVFNELAWGSGGGLVIQLKNQSGKEIAPVLRDDTLLPPPLADPHTNSLLLNLDEGEFFGIRRVLPISDLVRRPGKYTLQIEYRSPLFCKTADAGLHDLPVIWHEDGSLFSNIASFTVRP
jgi:hypothetical protein